MTLDFVALDFETANPKRGSIIQLGIARIENSQLVGKATVFITPPPNLGRFAPRNIAVHSIRPVDIVGAPSWPETLERITTFAGGLPLLAHNAEFERSCIIQASEAHGLAAPNFAYFCTFKLAKLELPGADNHKLDTLTRHLGLPSFGHHDAGEDAIACARLAVALAHRAGALSLDDVPAGWLASKRVVAA